MPKLNMRGNAQRYGRPAVRWVTSVLFFAVCRPQFAVYNAVSRLTDVSLCSSREVVCNWDQDFFFAVFFLCVVVVVVVVFLLNEDSQYLLWR